MPTNTGVMFQPSKKFAMTTAPRVHAKRRRQPSQDCEPFSVEASIPLTSRRGNNSPEDSHQRCFFSGANSQVPRRRFAANDSPLAPQAFSPTGQSPLTAASPDWLTIKNWLNEITREVAAAEHQVQFHAVGV